MTSPRGGMVTLVEASALALWLGASLFFAVVVAPAAFAVLPTPALAGALVGRALPPLFISGIAVAAVVIGLEVGSRRPRRRVRAIGGGVLLVACAAAQFVVGRQIERLRRAAPAPIAALSDEDPRRRSFGRLHALSVATLGLAMLAAVTALVAVRTHDPAR